MKQQWNSLFFWAVVYDNHDVIIEFLNRKYIPYIDRGYGQLEIITYKQFNALDWEDERLYPPMQDQVNLVSLRNIVKLCIDFNRYEIIVMLFQCFGAEALPTNITTHSRLLRFLIPYLDESTLKSMIAERLSLDIIDQFIDLFPIEDTDRSNPRERYILYRQNKLDLNDLYVQLKSIRPKMSKELFLAVALNRKDTKDLVERYDVSIYAKLASLCAFFDNYHLFVHVVDSMLKHTPDINDLIYTEVDVYGRSQFSLYLFERQIRCEWTRNELYEYIDQYHPKIDGQFSWAEIYYMIEQGYWTPNWLLHTPFKASIRQGLRDRYLDLRSHHIADDILDDQGEWETALSILTDPQYQY